MRLPKSIRQLLSVARSFVVARPLLTALLPTGGFSWFVGHLANIATSQPHIVALSAGLAVLLGLSIASASQDFFRKNTIKGKLHVCKIQLFKISDQSWAITYAYENLSPTSLYFKVRRSHHSIGTTNEALGESGFKEPTIIPCESPRPVGSATISAVPSPGNDATGDLEILYGKDKDELFEKLEIEFQVRPVNYGDVANCPPGKAINSVSRITKFELRGT